jgi:hypothetical protein
MRKWWRKFKNRRGWDFKKICVGSFIFRATKATKHSSCDGSCYNIRESYIISDPNDCYSYTCSYCGKQLLFPWKETLLAYHNMQRHIKAKHIDAL